jgi:hypothetical protein
MRNDNTKLRNDFRLRSRPRKSCWLNVDDIQSDQQQSQGDTTRSSDSDDQAHSKNYLSHTSLSKRATQVVCEISLQAPDATATDPRFS